MDSMLHLEQNYDIEFGVHPISDYYEFSHYAFDAIEFSIESNISTLDLHNRMLRCYEYCLMYQHKKQRLSFIRSIKGHIDFLKCLLN